MGKISRASMLAGVLVLMSVQSRAQDGQTIADVRCVVVGLEMAALTDTSQRSAGIMLSMYFIGRLDGRVPALHLEDLIVKEVSKMTKSDFSTEAQRCGGLLKDRGLQITQMGKDIKEHAQNSPAKPTAPSP